MTDRATLLALAERCEQAAGPDRVLDAEIAVGLFGGEVVWKTARYTMDAYPARRVQNSDYIGGYQNAAIPVYTESLDAAIALVPEGPCWIRQDYWRGTQRQHYQPMASIMLCGEPGKASTHTGKADTPALALCAAALRARAAANE
jgi:hypothetical protein